MAPGTTPVAVPAPVVPVVPALAKSAKRGIAYDLTSAADLQVLSPGVSWWYNWGTKPGIDVKVDVLKATYQINPGIKYLLLMNEPNLVDQANMTPAVAAAQWPKYEAIAQATGVKLVGPAITWGTMTNFSDPVVWMDAFLAAYQAANGGKSPQIDYLAFHWYDYDLAGQLDRLLKYGKPFWVTEMANWHGGNDGAQIDTLARQKTQMTEMVAVCEGRADVFRYAWFIGRMSPDPHFTSLLAGDGVLSELGKLYLSLPYTKT
ncbi:MAG: glycoside hydrolase family protein [Pseudomonadota bacterium]|nr:glycoside hydrolase family protein [Pseudomonadota bacterium]